MRYFPFLYHFIIQHRNILFPCKSIRAAYETHLSVKKISDIAMFRTLAKKIQNEVRHRLQLLHIVADVDFIEHFKSCLTSYSGT